MIRLERGASAIGRLAHRLAILPHLCDVFPIDPLAVAVCRKISDLTPTAEGKA